MLIFKTPIEAPVSGPKKGSRGTHGTRRTKHDCRRSGPSGIERMRRIAKRPWSGVVLSGRRRRWLLPRLVSIRYRSWKLPRIWVSPFGCSGSGGEKTTSPNPIGGMVVCGSVPCKCNGCSGFGSFLSSMDRESLRPSDRSWRALRVWCM